MGALGAEGPGHAARVRTAACLYAIGAALTLAGMVLPHTAEADLTGFGALAAAMAAIAAALWMGGARLPRWTPQAAMFAGSAVIAAALWFSGERRGGSAALNELLYPWIALYAGYFFGRRQIAAQVAGVAVSYAVALALISPGPIAFTRWSICLAVVATVAALVRVLKERNDELVARLSVAAVTDGLTGLLNRQGFDERFDLEIERARRGGHSLALALCDLDDLKGLNDRLGHVEGDQALRRIGGLLAGEDRRIDAAARIGGDEFALLLPATDAEGARELVERLRGQMPTEPDGAPVTMSCGIVEFPAHGENRTDLVNAADRALYRAKALGRDGSAVLGRAEPITAPAQ